MAAEGPSIIDVESPAAISDVAGDPVLATDSPAAPEAGTNAFPLSAEEMHAWLVKMHSGSFVAVSGIAGRQDISDPHHLTTEQKKAFERFFHLQSLQNHINALEKEAQQLMDALITLDPANEAYLREWRQLLVQEKELDEALTRTGERVQETKALVDQDKKSLLDAIKTGEESDNDLYKEAAGITRTRDTVGQKIVTITHRFDGEKSEMPQHIVFQDEGATAGQPHTLFILKPDGVTKIYLEDLALSKEEINDLNRQIRKGEKFGNQSPESAEQYRAATAALEQKLSDNDPYMKLFDHMLAEGRRLRREANNNERDHEKLGEQRDKITQRIDELENQIGKTPESREILKKLKEKLEEIETRRAELTEEIARNHKELQTAIEIKNYTAEGKFTREAFIETMQDDEMKSMFLDLIRRQEEIDAKKLQLHTDEEKLEIAGDKMMKFWEEFSPFGTSTLDRKTYDLQMPDNPETSSKMLRDKAGNIVYYDRESGDMYHWSVDPATGKKTRIDYTDPATIIDLTREAWSPKIFGNENELGDLTLGRHLEQVNLIAGFEKIHYMAEEKSLEQEQILLDMEKEKITGANSHENTYTPFADSLDVQGPAVQIAQAENTAPGQSYTSAFNEVAPPPAQSQPTSDHSRKLDKSFKTTA